MFSIIGCRIRTEEMALAVTGSTAKEILRKIGNIALWLFTLLLVLLGLILMLSGSWSGILAILAGATLAPIIKKWLPLSIKTWQRISACIILFIAACALSVPTDDINSSTDTNLQASEVPVSPSMEDRIFTVKFDAGEYVGKIVDGKPNESGTLTYENLGIYTGTFRDGKRNGVGSFAWENGDIYSGEWQDDKINGSGIITFSDGAKLTAVFSNNEIISGDYAWTDNNGTYKMHVDNSPNSEPVYTLEAKYVNDVSYKGNFANGNLNGSGTMLYPNIGSYIGGFENGKKSGDGQFLWIDGDKFSGTWVNDQMDGQGLYTFSDGSTLSGNFKANVPQGTLTYTYQGKTYSTVWYNGACTSISKA